MSRLQPGIEVPWVTAWSDEESLGVGPCPSVGGRLAVLQAERPGQGRPIYSMNHFRRQRESVLGMLCPMCGRPTRVGDRWTQIATPTRAGELRAKGLDAFLPRQIEDRRAIVDAGSIAPLHKACAEHSLSQCPHLKAHASGRLLEFPAAWFTAPLLVEVTPPPGASLLARALPSAAIGFVQLFGVAEPAKGPARRLARLRA